MTFFFSRSGFFSKNIPSFLYWSHQKRKCRTVAWITDYLFHKKWKDCLLDFQTVSSSSFFQPDRVAEAFRKKNARKRYDITKWTLSLTREDWRSKMHACFLGDTKTRLVDKQREVCSRTERGRWKKIRFQTVGRLTWGRFISFFNSPHLKSHQNWAKLTG